MFGANLTPPVKLLEKTILFSSTLKSEGGRGLVVKTPRAGADVTSLSDPGGNTSRETLVR